MSTQEGLIEAFESSITDMQRLVLKAVKEGRGDLVSPTCMIVMRQVPDLKGLPFDFEPLESNPGLEAGPKIGIFSPITLTPPGMSRMPKDIFWHVMKMLAMASNAYGTIIGMEAWVARPATAEDAEKIPARLEDYDKREEALVVTAEREGEYHLYQAFMKREGDQLTFAPWEKHVTADGPNLRGNVFRSVPANTKN